MADLLIELFSEEIPARMQAKARQDLERLVCAGLRDAGLAFGAAASDVTPRRLVLTIEGVAGATPDVREERRGPRVGAPEKALEGFMRGAGVTRDQLEEREEKKGSFYFVVIDKPGRAAAEVIAEVLEGVIRTFPWPKSQRWGTGDLRWVRPLQRIICLLDDQVVPLSVDGIEASNVSEGHRFMARGPFEVTSISDYRAKLLAHKVILSAERRKTLIADSCGTLASAKGLDWVRDEGLLDEVAGLVEWPVPMLGSFDADFLEVPEETLILTMKKDQKYFVLRDPNTGRLSNSFIFTANFEPADGGAIVTGGNERVLAARLSDARFFWEQDKTETLESRLPQLDDIVFHEKLGTVGDRVRRMAKIAVAEQVATQIEGCDPAKARRAAELSKADLVSSMVYEFPELQGVVGRYLAIHEGLDAEVAEAIRDHYSPLGPGDACPSAPVSIAVALAEKLDTLVRFFDIGMLPTGSKDPFALRRAALGVLRLIIENGVRIRLKTLFEVCWLVVGKDTGSGRENTQTIVAEQLFAFFQDRLKVQQRERGVRHDFLDAVFANGDDDLVRVIKRVDALAVLMASEDGENLLAGYKRAANIIASEAKKGSKPSDSVDPAHLTEDASKALFAALEAADQPIRAALDGEDFASAAGQLAALRPVIDRFFDDVLVVSDDAGATANRLALLAGFQVLADSIADFSRIEG